MWTMRREVDPMTGTGWGTGGSPSIESLHGLRLRALLHDLVNDLGPGKAADELGVDRKTLRRGLREPELSSRLADALERFLLRRTAAAAAEEAARVDALTERVAALERQMVQVLAEIGDGADGTGAMADTLRQEFALEFQRLEGLLERREASPERGPGGCGALRADSRRRYADLVVRQPADDDERVYGDSWPLVEEWRRLWDSYPSRGRGLAWVLARERILELEVAMLVEHGLTLPQETTPLKGLDRNEQIGWRQRELAGIRRRRARLELLRLARRVLTLGLWRR